MPAITSFRQLTPTEARPFALNAEGYSVQGNMAVHVSQFLKNPKTTLVGKTKSPKGGMLFYYKTIFTDAEGDTIVYEMVCDDQTRAVLKATGEDLAKSSHFFVNDAKYPSKGNKAKLEPIFEEIKGLVLGDVPI